MAVPRSWFAIVRKKFLARTPKFGPHSKNIIIIHNNTSITSNEEDNRTSCVDLAKDGIAISSSSPGHDEEVRTTGVTEELDGLRNGSTTTDGSKEEDEEIKTSSGVDSSTTEEEEESLEEDSKDTVPGEDEINAAATRIQSVFRGHLARRARRALRSLVKLQAVARGVHIRKQVSTALNCMHALVRLQLRVRARKLLEGSNNHS